MNEKKEKEMNISDINDVAQWLNTTVENIDIQYQQESIEGYEKDAKDMYLSYDEFPQDRKRTEKIINILKKGGTLLPLYVEKNDAHNFVMEGRHRLVAFYLLGYKEIIVARCALKNKLKF